MKQPAPLAPPAPEQVNVYALPDSALLRQKRLEPVLPFGHSSLWSRVKKGTFPAPIRFENSNITAWRWGDVRNWLDEQYQKGRSA